MSDVTPLFAGYAAGWAVYAAGLALFIGAQLWLLRRLGWRLAVGSALLTAVAVGLPVNAYVGEPALAPALWVALYEGLLLDSGFARGGAPLATTLVVSQLGYWLLVTVIWLLTRLLRRGR